MNILVIGSGAMGCLFGGLLHEAGHAVRLLARNSRAAATLRERGVRIEDAAGMRACAMPVCTGADAEPDCDVVLLCVKAYDTPAAMDTAMTPAGDEALVVSLQNGWGHVALLEDRFGADRVVCGATAQGATLRGVGHVWHGGCGPTTVAACDAGTQTAAGTIATLLSGAGIATVVGEDLRGVLWSKLVLNAALNPVTALYGLRNGELLAAPEPAALAREAVAEAEAVAGRLGIALQYADAAAALEAVCRATAANSSSMLQDITARRRSEVDFINGVLVAEAERLDLDVPVNRALLDRIHERSAIRYRVELYLTKLTDRPRADAV